jgi:hypothetical protein
MNSGASVSLGNIKYSLKNPENYKTDMSEFSSYSILEKYTSLVHEYVKGMLECSKSSSSHSVFLLMRGLETITHVFRLLLLYTRNLDACFYTSQKAYYYYIEFIGQISNIQQTFLDLSSTDAVIYVYNKTIYDLNHEQKKKNAATLSIDDKKKLEELDDLCLLYKECVPVFLSMDSPMEKKVIGMGLFESACFQYIKEPFHVRREKLANLLDYLRNNEGNVSVEELIHFIHFLKK